VSRTERAVAADVVIIGESLGASHMRVLRIL
jgi:hypothetical protein